MAGVAALKQLVGFLLGIAYTPNEAQGLQLLLAKDVDGPIFVSREPIAFILAIDIQKELDLAIVVVKVSQPGVEVQESLLEVFQSNEVSMALARLLSKLQSNRSKVHVPIDVHPVEGKQLVELLVPGECLELFVAQSRHIILAFALQSRRP